MWTDSKLIKSLMFSVLFGAAGTVVAAIPTSPETMVVQQGNKVSGLVSDDMGPVAGASVVVKGTSVGTIPIPTADLAWIMSGGDRLL